MERRQAILTAAKSQATPPLSHMETHHRRVEAWCKSQFQSSAAELVKVKNMILVLNERLTAMEDGGETSQRR